VGAFAAEKLEEYLGTSITFILANTSTTTPGALNNACGADYVKTQQKLPPSLSGVLKPGQRACSLDGDADRLMYFYLDEHSHFHMLDGDKIAALLAAFIGEVVKTAGLDEVIKVGIVQTAYANGASTKYLAKASISIVSFILLLTFDSEGARKMCPHRCKASASCCGEF
jgi:phosphoacetylglucosamine mutase